MSVAVPTPSAAPIVLSGTVGSQPLLASSPLGETKTSVQAEKSVDNPLDRSAAARSPLIPPPSPTARSLPTLAPATSTSSGVQVGPSVAKFSPVPTTAPPASACTATSIICPDG